MYECGKGPLTTNAYGTGAGAGAGAVDHCHCRRVHLLLVYQPSISLQIDKLVEIATCRRRRKLPCCRRLSPPPPTGTYRHLQVPIYI